MRTLTDPVEISRAFGPRTPEPGIAIFASQVPLPFVTFTGVPVRRLREEDLGLVERFALEMGLRLGPFDSEDVEAVTSIPARAARRFLDRLARTEALAHLGEGLFTVREEAARRVLKEAKVREEVIVPQDFLWLPRTGDVIAMEAKDPGFTLLRELRPAAERAPVPWEYATRRRLEWLEERIVRRTVLNLHREIIGVKLAGADEDPPLPRFCARFTGTGCFREGCRGLEIWLQPFEEVVKPRGSHGSPDVILPATSGLRVEWQELASAPCLPGNFKRVADALDLRPGELHSICATGEAEYALAINEESARRIFDRDGELLKPIGLTVRSPEHTDVLVDARLKPADPPRAFSFALATVILQLLNTEPGAAPAAETMRAAVAAARAAYPLDDITAPQVNPGKVREYLWKQRAFAWIYSLREKVDFAYDNQD